jgi:DNA-binding HxlR family transcriptional regulator
MQQPGGVAPLHDQVAADDQIAGNEADQVATPGCSIAAALEIVGDRWTILILRDAFRGIRRFDELRRDLDIPRAVLSERLRRLVEHGVLVKRSYQERPVRYEYRLTPMGLQLSPILVSLMQWGDRWLSGEDGPPTLLVHEPCGTEIDLGFHCWHCDESFTPTEIVSRPGPGDHSITATPTTGTSNRAATPSRAAHEPRSATGARTTRTARPVAG